MFRDLNGVWDLFSPTSANDSFCELKKKDRHIKLGGCVVKRKSEKRQDRQINWRNMNRHIPGEIDVKGREFFYVEIRDGEGFRKIISEALAGAPDLPPPQSGGVIEENVKVLLDESTWLLGISYKGDLPGWKAKLVAFCHATHRQWGIVSHQKLCLADGSELELKDCRVLFEDDEDVDRKGK